MELFKEMQICTCTEEKMGNDRIAYPIRNVELIVIHVESADQPTCGDVDPNWAKASLMMF